MAWFLLTLAGLLEVAWAVGLKYSEGFTRLWPSIFTIFSMLLSFWLLSLAMETLPLGTSYAVWTGIGTIGTVLFGIFWFEEPISFLKILALSLIFLGIIGVKVLA
jgi:quaternary ammonium compound-resistance protein SugE